MRRGRGEGGYDVRRGGGGGGADTMQDAGQSIPYESSWKKVVSSSIQESLLCPDWTKNGQTMSSD